MTVAIDSPFTAEELEPTLRPLLEASLLPARAYTDDDVAEWERQNLFLGGWVCVGHVSALADRGAYLTFQLGEESLLFIGDGEGNARGFFNVCRHRAARLLTERRGHDAAPAVPLPRMELRLRRHAARTRRTPTS